MKINDWGVIDYGEAWEKQSAIFSEIIERKKHSQNTVDTHELQQIVLCEHPHVYTLGRNGDGDNMLINEDRLKAINATYYKTDRGGDITYHGYGQLVVYPILDLQALGLSLKEYIHSLEEVVIQILADYGLKAERVDSAVGVWLDASKPTARKICAIGVRASHFVTMHGLAFNISTDLSYFNHINPCGFIDKGVTSLEKELGHPINFEEVKEKMKQKLRNILLKET